MMTYDKSDLDTMAKTLWGECRGQPVEGEYAVAWVIRNRSERPRFCGARAGKPGAVAYVCLAPWQFSCWNSADPNRAQIDKLLPAQYDHQFKIALDVVSGTGKGDPTNGSDHYHTIAKPSWATAWPPDWAAQMREVARFGGHVFYDSGSRAPQPVAATVIDIAMPPPAPVLTKRPWWQFWA